MDTRRTLEKLAKMTPEQLEALQRIKARLLTPEHRAEEAADQEQIRKEFPPLQRDQKTIEP